MKEINNFDKIFPPQYPIVFLHAHPDDEVFLSAGIINKLIKLKRKCIIIFCAAAIVKDETLTVIRQKEAKIACKILGLDSILFLKYCEPQYVYKNTSPFCKEKKYDICLHLIEIIKKNKIPYPFILVSYDKNGGYGNIDHSKINKIGKMFHKQFKKYVYNYFEITINRDNVKLWLHNVQDSYPSNLIPKLSYWSNNFGLKESEIRFFYKLTPEELYDKRKAFFAHTSGIPIDEFPLTNSMDDFYKLFGYEYLA